MAQDLFIGLKKVVSNETLDAKLPTGDDVFEVKYDDGTVEHLTRKMFEATVRDLPTDLTTLRDNRTFPVVGAVLELLLTWGAKVSEVDYLFNSVVSSLNASVAAADKQIWGKDRQNVTFLDLDAVLRAPTPAPSIDAPTGVTLKDVLPPAGGTSPSSPDGT